MDRKRSSVGTAAYVASTLIAALLFSVFAAWAQTKLEPSEVAILYLVNAPWFREGAKGHAANGDPMNSEVHDTGARTVRGPATKAQHSQLTQHTN